MRVSRFQAAANRHTAINVARRPMVTSSANGGVARNSAAKSDALGVL